MIPVKIALPASIDKEIRYIWEVFADYIGFEYQLVSENAEITISDQPEATIRISKQFIRNFEKKEFHFQQYFSDQPLIVGENGTPDYLGTCFYMINCLQEYAPGQSDQYGRFQYKNSYQYRFNCPEKRLVNQYFEQLYQETRFLRDQVIPKKRKGKVFLSHDIDRINFGLLSESKNALMKGRFDVLFKVLLRELSGTPQWMNMREIVALHEKHGFQSTFFWLPCQGVANGINNADYNYQSEKVQQLVNYISGHGFENGLHKSSYNTSFQDEIGKLGFQPTANRNHYLKITLPSTFNEIENAGIKVDSSLGFAETIGFRNSYSLPFHPYHLKERRKYNFIEVPLNIMDTTLCNYLKLPPEKAFEQVAQFFSENKENAVIAILWHNNYLTPYKFGKWLKLYEQLLKQLSKLNIAPVLPSHLSAISSEKGNDKA